MDPSERKLNNIFPSVALTYTKSQISRTIHTISRNQAADVRVLRWGLWMSWIACVTWFTTKRHHLTSSVDICKGVVTTGENIYHNKDQSTHSFWEIWCLFNKKYDLRWFLRELMSFNTIYLYWIPSSFVHAVSVREGIRWWE